MNKTAMYFGVGCLMLVVLAACGYGSLLMLSEGPHGPGDEITWAPGQGYAILGLFGLSLAAFVASIYLTTPKKWK